MPLQEGVSTAMSSVGPAQSRAQTSDRLNRHLPKSPARKRSRPCWDIQTHCGRERWKKRLMIQVRVFSLNSRI